MTITIINTTIIITITTTNVTYNSFSVFRCWSNVGREYYVPGAQEISIGPGCNSKGIIMHEIMHALGFWHEQSRTDRDNYLAVLWENVKPGRN